MPASLYERCPAQGKASLRHSHVLRSPGRHSPIARTFPFAFISIPPPCLYCEIKPRRNEAMKIAAYHPLPRSAWRRGRLWGCCSRRRKPSAGVTPSTSSSSTTTPTFVSVSCGGDELVHSVISRPRLMGRARWCKCWERRPGLTSSGDERAFIG